MSPVSCTNAQDLTFPGDQAVATCASEALILACKNCQNQSGLRSICASSSSLFSSSDN